MLNSQFRFKQFTVEQSQCAMKVSSDACIQGALAAKYYNQPKHVLDIGAGTGLLSLMMAQTFSGAQITALEINEEAANQARKNFQRSLWNKRLKVVTTSVQDFLMHEPDLRFDAIISNPPFFSKHLLSPTEQRTNARHDITLSKNDLAQTVASLLTEDGILCVMYPANEWDEWQRKGEEYGLFVRQFYEIYSKENIRSNRMIAMMCKEKSNFSSKQLFIRNTDGNYTSEFKSLMRDWYLHEI